VKKNTKYKLVLLLGLVLFSASVLVLILVPPIMDTILKSSTLAVLMISIIGFPFAFLGSLLTSNCLHSVTKLSPVYVVISVLVSLFSGIVWVISIVSAVAMYDGSDIGLGFHVGSLIASIIFGILGGLMLGRGLPGKMRKSADD